MLEKIWKLLLNISINGNYAKNWPKTNVRMKLLEWVERKNDQLKDHECMRCRHRNRIVYWKKNVRKTESNSKPTNISLFLPLEVWCSAKNCRVVLAWEDECDCNSHTFGFQWNTNMVFDIFIRCDSGRDKENRIERGVRSGSENRMHIRKTENGIFLFILLLRYSTYSIWEDKQTASLERNTDTCFWNNQRNNGTFHTNSYHTESYKR